LRLRPNNGNTKLKNRPVVLSIVITLVCAVALVSAPKKPAPADLNLTDLEGKKVHLKDYRGKLVVVNFWATWCVPCRAQHPLYDEVKQRFRERDDVVFLSVDTDEDRGLVAPFIEAQHWSGNVFFDDGLVRLLSINSIPSTMIADKQGRIVSRMNGFTRDTFVEQLTARIKAALGEK
jgi:thiol-disulfide isomerase/thioredoxin